MVFFYDRCHGHKDAAAIRAKKFVYENYFFQTMSKWQLEPIQTKFNCKFNSS
jgi:hypothetical protein